MTVRRHIGPLVLCQLISHFDEIDVSHDVEVNEVTLVAELDAELPAGGHVTPPGRIWYTNTSQEA